MFQQSGKSRRPERRGRRNRQNRGNANQKNPYSSPGLTQLIPAYPGQPVWAGKIQSLPTTLTTTVTTGVVSTSIGIDADLIQDFSTRFNSTWKEYRCVKAVSEVRMFSSVNPGVLKFWFDETSATAPTSSVALHATGREVNFSEVDTIHFITWRPSDPKDLDYNSTAVTNLNPVYLKLYSDSAFFGAPTAVTSVASVRTTFTLQFRGFA